MRDAVDHWVNLIHDDIGFKDVDVVRETLYAMADNHNLMFFCIDFTGIFAYIEAPDFKGGKSLVELMFYIKPCYRGSLKLVRKYIKRAEREAKKLGCASIQIGANIEYKDSSLIKLLKRWGYIDHTVIKYLEV